MVAEATRTRASVLVSERPPDAAARRLTVATYNVHGCVGSDGRFDAERTARVLDELDADLIALQEVESFPVDGVLVLEFLAARTGLTPLAGPTMLRRGRHYGNALLTRLPVASERRIDLSVAGREPRGAIDARLAWNERTLQAVATHLGLAPRERRQQVERLLGALETSAADFALLLGDFNECALWGRPSRRLRRYFSATPGPRTYPARCPLLPLDRIWARPRSALSGVRAHDSALARRASDHLPLVALLRSGPRP